MDGIQNQTKILLKMLISVYNTCTLLEKYVDANLDASDNAFSGNAPLSEMLTSQSQIPE